MAIASATEPGKLVLDFLCSFHIEMPPAKSGGISFSSQRLGSMVLLPVISGEGMPDPLPDRRTLCPSFQKQIH